MIEKNLHEKGIQVLLCLYHHLDSGRNQPKNATEYPGVLSKLY